MKLQKLSKTNDISTDKLVFTIIGGLTVLALVLIVFFSIGEGKQTQGSENIPSYSKNDTLKPKVSISNLSADLGTMKASDEKKADFTIENTGSKSLQIFKVSSSCDCTFGQITIEDKVSPEFSMHSKNKWIGTIAPEKKATLSVIYRPFIMPVKGEVTREVFMETNDPDNPRLDFTVKANVN